MFNRLFQVMLVLLPLCNQAQNQTGKDNDIKIYNAYTLSKELVLLERKFSSVHKLEQNDLQRIFSYLIWYADLQDNDLNSQIISLNERLVAYKKLQNLYSKIFGTIDDTTKLMSITSLYFDSIYSKVIKESTVKKKLSEIYRSLELVKNNIKSREEDSLQLRQDSIRFQTLKKNGKDSLNSIIESLLVRRREFQDTITLMKDSVRLESSLKNLDVLITNHSKTQKKNNEDKATETGLLQKFKTSLLDYLDSPDDQTDKMAFKSLIKASNLSSIEFKRYLDEKAIKEQIEEIKNAHEIVINEADKSALKFRFPSQSDIIDAIAIYLAKRVKQEAVMWFFETIKKNATQYELIQTFFPNTITLLQSNEVYEIPNLGSQWRYALSKDFVKLPRNVIESPWFEKWFLKKVGDNSLVLEYLKAGFDIGDLLIQRYSYKNLVKQMYLQLNNVVITEKNSAYLRPGDIFSLLYAINQECFVSTQKDTSYRLIQFEDLRNMNKDEIEIMLSLMDMKYGGSVKKFWTTSANQVFELKLEQMNSLRRWLGGIESGIKQFEKIQDDFNKTQEDIKDGKKEDAVFSLFNLWENVNALFNLVIPNPALRPDWMKGITENSEKVKAFTQMGFEVYNQITLKNYAGAVNTTISILEKLFYHNGDRFTISDVVIRERLKVRKYKNGNYIARYPTIVEDKIKEDQDRRIKLNSAIMDSLKSKGISINSFSTGDSLRFGLQDVSVHSFKRTDIWAAILFERDRHAINLIRRLAGFLNDVMLTTDSRKLAKVVESYALPPGSYKRKRNSWWSLDLNAFVGAYGGYEIARKKIDRDVPALQSKGWVYGVTAPIGISLSRTFGRRLQGDTVNEALIRNPDKIRMGKKNIIQRGNTTFTITASIIDVGAVVSYRFNNTADSVLPQEVKWSQVFSPGLHFSLGLRNTPLAISAGYQYTPQLRKIDETQDPKKRQYNANRLYIGLLFDIPLANLWQRSFYGPKMSRRE